MCVGGDRCWKIGAIEWVLKDFQNERSVEIKWFSEKINLKEKSNQIWMQEKRKKNYNDAPKVFRKWLAVSLWETEKK